MVRAHRRDLTLVLTGAGHDGRTLPEGVVSRGLVSDDELVRLYQTASATVFPSLWEGFGLPPVEAMACGCPVVVSRGTSLPEVCGDAARYVDPLSPGDIASGIEDVLRNPVGLVEAGRAEGRAAHARGVRARPRRRLWGAHHVSAGTGFQRAFSRLVAALSRAGVERVPGARPAYALLHRLVFPGGEQRVVVNGMPMWVDTRDRVIATHLLGDEIWEASETAAFLAHVRPGMCVFDVGANIGYYTLLAARAVGPSGRVYAFEPEPHNFELLTRNVAENRFTNVRAINAAVSNRVGVVRLHLDDANFGSASPSRSVRSVRRRAAPVEVETVRLDDYADEAHSLRSRRSREGRRPGR